MGQTSKQPKHQYPTAPSLQGSGSVQGWGRQQHAASPTGIEVSTTCVPAAVTARTLLTAALPAAQLALPRLMTGGAMSTTAAAPLPLLLPPPLLPPELPPKLEAAATEGQGLPPPRHTLRVEDGCEAMP